MFQQEMMTEMRDKKTYREEGDDEIRCRGGGFTVCL